MPRVSTIEVLQKSEQPYIAIRTKTSVDKLPMLIGQSYGKMAEYLKELGECLADVPFVAYHTMDMENLDVEIGFPTATALPGKEDIQSGTIPAGKVVFSIHRGSYMEIEGTYMEMANWIAENGVEPTGIAYEFYYNGPEFPESEYLTRIVMPIR